MNSKKGHDDGLQKASIYSEQTERKACSQRPNAFLERKDVREENWLKMKKVIKKRFRLDRNPDEALDAKASFEYIQDTSHLGNI